ncbi:efflux transporter outer membrane subunit [uncultured Azohydromonas sp.]|jgi:efflux transporter, outer membrane factor (OMF) lipoprotein, NodT family|uniref:efflux transporter outer membrane subunit n=1 Tax=uncultured Azohydromonas sp. TaxID=487342 RepID=UPI0026244315|nr:efflux transporter outer membrane subunit [uncultured Azohydromonas sp.]
MNRRRLIPVAAALALLVGCATVGPDFHAPAPAVPAQRPTSAPDLASGLPVSEKVLPQRWWTVFGDPVLDGLQARLLENSLDLRNAVLRFAQSRLQRSVVASQALPHVDARAQATRQRQSEHGAETRLVRALPGANREEIAELLAEPFPLYQAGFDASWELDLWGRVRRSVESADAGVEAADALLAQARLALSGELARAYFNLRLAQRQQALLDEQAAVARDALGLLEGQAAHGLIADDEVLAQRARVAELQALRPPLRAREAALLNQLTTLSGVLPGALNEALAPLPLPADAAAPALPDLALGLPSALARRRPDLRAAEAQLHAATADIGIAVADLYPRIALGASAGLQSIEAGRFGEWSSRTWQIGPVLSLPLFDHGRRRATVELRKLQQQQAAVAYQQAVLKAWQEIDDALADYAAQRQRHARLRERLDERHRAWALAQGRRASGLSSELPVLQARQAWLQARADLADNDARLSTALVAVFKAAGGGMDGGE